MTAVSRTAAYVALYRALESQRAGALFQDPFAIRFLPRELKAAVRVARVPALARALSWYSDRRVPGARTSAIARTARLDDLVRDAVAGRSGAGGAAARAPVGQVVLLGAGFDCRAHRLPELAGVPVFEVDRAETQAVKRARLAAAPGDADARVRYVAVDFLRDDAFAKLCEAGWRREIPSMIVWEGVTNYLSEDAVLRVLGEVATCAAGTVIAFTYIHRGVLDAPAAFTGGPRVVADVKALGEPWTFGLAPEDVAGFVERAGLALRSDEGADDYRRRYLGATSPGYAFYRLAVAERAPA